MHSREPQAGERTGLRYRLVEHGGFLCYQRCLALEGAEWEICYRFHPRGHQLLSFEATCNYTQSDPESLFVRGGPIINLFCDLSRAGAHFTSEEASVPSDTANLDGRMHIAKGRAQLRDLATETKMADGDDGEPLEQVLARCFGVEGLALAR